ncbi:winged helix-turn-helix transcriptional regulator [Candidatus Woesearchaeota archaeon]|nr:winged helix-turn-helix transcriptional regulator [Candidatus Woesearchaeota archaeon]
MAGKETLDLHVFKALSTQTRLDILKEISEKPKTLTELAGRLRLSPSTVKEHLQKLEKAGLIKADSGRKWKYYEPGPKAWFLIRQTSTSPFWIALGIFAVSVYGAVTRLANVAVAPAAESTRALAAPAIMQEPIVQSTSVSQDFSLFVVIAALALAYAIYFLKQRSLFR